MSPQRDKHTAFQATLKYAEIGLCKPEMPMSPHVEIKQAIYTKKPATFSFTFLRSVSHKVKSKRRMAGRNTRNPRYVVLIGDVGTGKSTIVEKLTNERGRASDKDTSVTKSSEVFWTMDGSIVISARQQRHGGQAGAQRVDRLRAQLQAGVQDLHRGQG